MNDLAMRAARMNYHCAVANGRLSPSIGDPRQELDPANTMNFVTLAKRQARHGMANALLGTGLLDRLVRRRLKGRALVLMYHRVLPPAAASRSFSHAGLIVSPETFRRHMNLVRERLRPLSLAEFMSHMEAGSEFPAGACLVTFDDGWSDNHEFALPILRELEIPAVVFAATDYIGADRPFWQEYLGYLLYESARLGRGDAVSREFQLDLRGGTDDAALRRAVAAVVDRFRAESYESIDRLTQALERALADSGDGNVASPPDRFMNWEQLRALADANIDIASHTRSHRALTRLDAATVTEELLLSRRVLAERIGRDLPVFAYPGGFHDDRVRQAAIECGYRLAFATEAGTASVTDDRWRIPRVNMHESATSTRALFMSRIAGLL